MTKTIGSMLWVDLEMTGLDPIKDKILEISAIVTDSELKTVARGMTVVIHQPKSVLQTMNDWCIKHHGESGLTKKSLESVIDLTQAEKYILEYVKKHTLEKKACLCGNSIHVDRRFIYFQMPRLESWLHYRNIDVSTIKELCYRWRPDIAPFVKKEKHRTLDDIMESIAELEYYRKCFFAAKPSVPERT